MKNLIKLKKLFFVISILGLLSSCSRYNYPMVTKYREPKVRYVRVKEIKEKKPKVHKEIPMIYKEVTVWLILSTFFGYMTLKEK